MTKPAPAASTEPTAPPPESKPPELGDAPTDPTPIATKPRRADRPVLRSVRFIGEAITFAGVTPAKAIHLGELAQPRGIEACVIGPSVFVGIPVEDGLDVIEVPRTSTILRWELPKPEKGVPFEQTARRVLGKP